MERIFFDIVVIGAGPGGIAAAIKASQMGKTVALIEKGNLGGTCLNEGCIPTKTLITNALMLDRIRHSSDFGIEVGSISFDYAKMKARKDSVLEKMKEDLKNLIQSQGIVIFQGKASFTSSKEIKIVGSDNIFISFTSAIIATGSESLDIKEFPCDHKKVFNSFSILEISKLPKKIAIIGGGYIGCEFASLFAELGVEVFLIEACPSILPHQGSDISSVMTQIFSKKGINIITEASTEKIATEGAGITVHIKGKPSIEADSALIAIGRKVISADLELEKAGVSVDSKGAIHVTDRMITKVPGIYAVGDVTGKVMLAHVASFQGTVAASNACGKEAHMSYKAVPSIIFTHPEIASVGLNAEQAEKEGLSYTIGKFPFQALARSIVTTETEGFAQILIENKTGRLLGAQVIGLEASSLISEIAILIQNGLTIDSISNTIHAHPTLSEVWFKAALVSLEASLKSALP